MNRFFGTIGFGFVLIASFVFISHAWAQSSELQLAYTYALNAGIITEASYADAHMLSKVTRKDAAKMFVIFAHRMNPSMQTNTGASCSFSDISRESTDSQNYMIQACQLGIMGRNSDGTSAIVFNPNVILTRAHVGTILSRILYGATHNWGSNRYINHLQALQKRGIMNNISKPNAPELRWYVLLMMMRADKGTAWPQNPPRSGNVQNPPRSGNIQNPPRSWNNQNPPATWSASGNQSSYSIAQAISDNAQLSTLAFDGLGFLAGNLCSDSFLPPGKVADFFGFQYLRDTTQAGKWHSTDFVTNAANNVLYILNDTQKAKMIALAKLQASDVNQYAYDRFPLMQAFRRQLAGDIPSWTAGLSKSAVMSYSADLYALDAKISIARAQLFAEIIKSLTATQIAYLDTMKTVGFAWRAALSDQIDKTSLTHDQHVLVMTYASEMFGWYAGDIEADTYFCPERQGDYFGGFYVKDAPAIGNAGYTIDETITADKWQEFLNVLTVTQKPIITSIVATQKTAITAIVEKRRAIATQLRTYRSATSIDEATVIALAREYGALDGEISYYYATNFAKVGATLTTAQKQQLTEIRGLTWYSCDGAYLYSEKIATPTIEDTDFLFK